MMSSRLGIYGAVLAVSAVAVAWGGVASAALRSHDLDARFGGQVSFRPLGRGVYAEYAKASLVAARSECEWIQAMDELAANDGLAILPPSSPPSADWTRESVVLIALGHMDGYEVEVRNVKQVGRKLYVDAHVEFGRPTGRMDRSPFHLVAVESKSFDAVVVRYDWAPPGLPTFLRVPSCALDSNLKRLQSQGLRPQGGGHTESSEAAVEAKASWGTLKIRYR